MSQAYARPVLLRTLAIIVAVLFAGRGVASACPVCFGASDSPMAEGMNAGVLVLLGVTATLLAAIAVVGWRIAARGRRQPSYDHIAAAQGDNS